MKRANRNALETRARVLVDRTQASVPPKRVLGSCGKGFVNMSRLNNAQERKTELLMMFFLFSFTECQIVL